jgi:hypothetical protein
MRPSAVPSRTHAIPEPHRCAGRVTFAKDAYDAPPGAAPFHRYLQTRRAPDAFEPQSSTRPRAPITPVIPDRPAPSARPALLPALGEVLPIEPDPRVRRIEIDIARRVVPATGQVLDLYA